MNINRDKEINGKSIRRERYSAKKDWTFIVCWHGPFYFTPLGSQLIDSKKEWRRKVFLAEKERFVSQNKKMREEVSNKGENLWKFIQDMFTLD